MTANQRRKESRSSGESSRRKSGVPSPKRSEEGFPSLELGSFRRTAVGLSLGGSGATQWNHAAVPITIDMPRTASICSPVFLRIFSMGTLRAACLSNAVHAACAESPSAFLAIHTPTASQEENGPISKKSAISVTGVLDGNVSSSERLCSRAHNHLAALIWSAAAFFQLDGEGPNGLAIKSRWRGLVLRMKKLADGPVSRILCRTQTAKQFACAAIIPLVPVSLPGSSSLPEGFQSTMASATAKGAFAHRAGPALPSYLALHHAGFSVPPVSPPKRWALTPPFHPCQTLRACRGRA